MMKRLFDVTLSLLGLVVLAPLFAVVAFLIALDSQGGIFFRQIRVGRNFRTFAIYKFRTMTSGADSQGSGITIGADSRITRVGRVLRRTKIDELPQLMNVLRGDMSLVGPRPEVPKFVAMFPDDYRDILRIRPGITDLASLKYRDESALLAKQPSKAEDYYVRVILPDKIRLGRRYLEDVSLWRDLQIIVRTLFGIAGGFDVGSEPGRGQ